jgi:homospermidine synthase
MDANTLLINVSINVDSIMLLKQCKEKNAFYIDTSLEQYENFINTPINEISNYEQFKKNNLYHQNLLAMKTIGNSSKTRIISGGMNPGFINEYAKKALKEYAKLKHKQLENGDYAKLGHELGLKEIQIVEYDTQKLKIKAEPQKFVSSWSASGLQEEGRDMILLSLNKDDLKELEETAKNEGFNVIKPTEGPKNTSIRFINRRGMNMTRESVALDDNAKPFKYSGMLIPHAETITLSDFFKYNGESPTIMYIYRPCDEALKSLEYFKANDYKILNENIVVRNKDVISGYDSICALLVFENGDRFIGGTICGKKDAEKFGFKSNCTVLQVAAFMNASIKWMLQNPKEGLNNVETIPHKFIFNHAAKYMGLNVFKML